MNTTDEILIAQVDEWHAPAALRRKVATSSFTKPPIQFLESYQALDGRTY